MELILAFTLPIFLIIVAVLYNQRKISFLNKSFTGIYLVFAPHIILFYYLFSNYTKIGQTHIVCKWIILIEIFIFIFYTWIKVNILPTIKLENVNTRLKLMIAGRQIVLLGLYTLFLQIPLYIIYFTESWHLIIPKHIFIIDLIIAILFILTLLANGMLRILCTSKRLNIVKRFITAFMSLIPIINIFAMLYACHVAAMEYDHECYKVNINKERVHSEICKTKYPLVLVHGVGFRDLKYINYWGRIPRELIRNGATIYYGNQEAWGTVQYNAHDIKNKILQIIKETGCEKVNIIAHSKGGLDARYMVSKLGMGKYVASLTMMSSPHRGCKFVDTACKIPDKIYKTVAKFFDKYYKILGDKNPDFYTASRQFSTYHSMNFNKEVTDVPDVYYQSYASAVKNIFSDYVVSIPYIFSKLTAGENDGLVSIDSAKWGDFRGVLRNNHRRGISHGDIIDLRREDYKGFDILEKYVEIVSELKNKGF
ncbi:alpha/beta hydrolase [Clostridium sp. CT7]|nr:alpha/beta hydrolase [Clostridium sp. CT7]